MHPIDAARRDRIHSWLLGVPVGSCVGVQGVQGCGKTHLCAELRERLARDGLRCEVLSLDDFYLPGLATTRGHPGTHDAELLARALRDLRVPDRAVDVPVFDKTARDGRGDRAPAWRRLRGGADYVLLEGWCVGYEPRGIEGEVDAALARYASAFYAHIDAMVVLRPPTADCAFAWRERAEAVARADGRGAMTRDEVRRFVAHYMPVYRAYEGRPLRWPRTLCVALADGR